MPLGLNVHNATPMPMDIPKWVTQNGDAMDVGKCIWEQGAGYVCNNAIYKGVHICLNPDSGKCHFQLDAIRENHSSVVVVDHNCIYIRSHCKRFLINEFHTVTHETNMNTCICNVYSVISCGVYFVSDVPTIKEMKIV